MMKFIKRVVPFLLINMLVSAATIYGVFVYWQHTHPAPAIATPIPVETQPTKPTSKASPITSSEVIIENVFGAGDLNTEYIMIRNSGTQPVNLHEWRLSGPQAESYKFPLLNLNQNGAVRLYSRAGTSSVVELYWGAFEAQWHSGDTLTLLDPAGSTQATFTIP